MMRRQKGQGLVEFALVLVVLIVVVAGMIDVAPLVFNLFTAKQMSARAARAASVYLPDGVRTCSGDAVAAAGDPWLLNATWSIELSANCANAGPSTFLAPGSPVIAQVTVDYTPLFWGGFGYPPKDTVSIWSFTTGTVDQAR